jgi:acetyl-CoA C-acetyltransferase/acetyl-CoA acyltransferase
MHRFPHTVFVAAGLRTPFGRGGGALGLPAMTGPVA